METQHEYTTGEALDKARDARLHFGTREDRFTFDAFSDRGHLLSFTVDAEDLIKAIAGIEHRMDCEIIHLAGTGGNNEQV